MPAYVQYSLTGRYNNPVLNLVNFIPPPPVRDYELGLCIEYECMQLIESTFPYPAFHRSLQTNQKNKRKIKLGNHVCVFACVNIKQTQAVEQNDTKMHTVDILHRFLQNSAEPEFLNFEGAQESIPRNQFRQAV